MMCIILQSTVSAGQETRFGKKIEMMLYKMLPVTVNLAITHMSVSMYSLQC